VGAEKGAGRGRDEREGKGEGREQAHSYKLLRSKHLLFGLRKRFPEVIKSGERGKKKTKNQT
jgi:hypothetical protein